MKINISNYYLKSMFLNFIILKYFIMFFTGSIASLATVIAFNKRCVNIKLSKIAVVIEIIKTSFLWKIFSIKNKYFIFLYFILHTTNTIMMQL